MSRKINISYFLLFLIMAGCVVENRYVDEPIEPMLQVDATLVAGEPITDIKIRQVFKATGSAPFEIGRDQLWVEGATIELYELARGSSYEEGHLIPVRERASEPGRFDAIDSKYVVKPSRDYHIKVSWRGMDVHATAKIPDYDAEDLHIDTTVPELMSETIKLERNSTGLGPPPVDTLVVYKSMVNLEQIIPYSSVSFQLATESELNALQVYPNFRFQVRNPLNYISLNIEENDYQFSHQQELYGYFRHDSDPAERKEINVRIVMVVPESIYADYILAEPSYLVPLLVTNVKGGAGLFFGAKRDTLHVSIEIPN